MAGNDLDQRSSYPDTWAGVASRVVDLAAESWPKMLRVCILVAICGAVLWLGIFAWLIIKG